MRVILGHDEDRQAIFRGTIIGKTFALMEGVSMVCRGKHTNSNRNGNHPGPCKTLANIASLKNCWNRADDLKDMTNCSEVDTNHHDQESSVGVAEHVTKEGDSVDNNPEEGSKYKGISGASTECTSGFFRAFGDLSRAITT